jgi:hypothetical protein
MTRFDASLNVPMLTRVPDEDVDALRFRRPRPANDFARFSKDRHVDDEVTEDAGETGCDVTAVDAGEDGTEICSALRRDEVEAE